MNFVFYCGSEDLAKKGKKETGWEKEKKGGEWRKEWDDGQDVKEGKKKNSEGRRERR